MQGSPPRGRGKAPLAAVRQSAVRITPAWAGKRREQEPCQRSRKDHPRVGGEKVTHNTDRKSRSGSPPRGRGKGIQRVVLFITRRITPAWAGKSSTLTKSFPAIQDHPRVGGEKFYVDEVLPGDTGSPPRGRGKDYSDCSKELRLRITPAWAGKRLKRSHRSGIFISGPIPFHSVLHRPAGSGGSRAGRDGSPAGQPQNTGPA